MNPVIPYTTLITILMWRSIKPSHIQPVHTLSLHLIHTPSILPPWHWIPWVRYQETTMNSMRYSQALKPTHSHHTDPMTSRFPWRKGQTLFTDQYTPYHHQNWQLFENS